MLVFWILDGDSSQVHLSRFQPTVKDVDVSEEVHHEWRCRMIEDILRRSCLLNVSLPHDDYLICDFKSLFLIMSDKDRGDVHLFVQTSQPCSQFLTNFGIECSEWLIQ